MTLPNTEGTKAQVYEGWQKILTKWLPFNLAMFLTVAGPSTYFNQMVYVNHTTYHHSPFFQNGAKTSLCEICFEGAGCKTRLESLIRPRL